MVYLSSTAPMSQSSEGSGYYWATWPERDKKKGLPVAESKKMLKMRIYWGSNPGLGKSIKVKIPRTNRCAIGSNENYVLLYERGGGG